MSTACLPPASQNQLVSSELSARSKQGDAKLYIDGFVAGATATNPDVVVNVSYTGSFGDTALAAEAANVHIGAGADVLTGSAQQVVGAIGVASEAGVPWLGTQSDQSPIDADIVVASQLYDWQPTLLDMIHKHQAGEFGGSAYVLTLENGGLVMNYNDNLDADAVAAAEKSSSGYRSRCHRRLLSDGPCRERNGRRRSGHDRHRTDPHRYRHAFCHHRPRLESIGFRLTIAHPRSVRR